MPAPIAAAPHRHILGLAAAGGLYYRRASLEKNAALIRSAVTRHGFRELDTAPWYGCGKSELDLGRTLAAMAKVSPTDDGNDATGEQQQQQLVINEKASLALPNSYSSTTSDYAKKTVIRVRTLHVRDSSAVEGASATIGVSPSSLLRIGTKCGRVILPRSAEPRLAAYGSGGGEAVGQSSTVAAVVGACSSAEQPPLCLSLSSDEAFITREFCTSASSSDTCSEDTESQRRRAAAVSERMRAMMAGATAAAEDAKGAADLAAGSTMASPSTTADAPTTTTTPAASGVTGTVYLANPETEALLCVHDCSFRGVLLSFAQSYERLFGPLHAAMGERVVIDSKTGLVRIVPSSSAAASDTSGSEEESLPWFLLDTLRLHDADSPALHREAIGAADDNNSKEGGIEAMRLLQRLGYVQHLSLGLNSAEYALIYLKDTARPFVAAAAAASHSAGADEVPSSLSCFSSVMLAGCWNLIFRDKHSAALFDFMRTLAVDAEGSVPQLLIAGEACEGQRQPSVAASPSLRPVELHNAGLFGAGLLWGASVYRYGLASTSLMAHRDALQRGLDAAIGTSSSSSAVTSSPAAADDDDDSFIAARYAADPSRFNLAGAALAYAQHSDALRGVAVRLAFGCGSEAEVEETMVALAHVPPAALVEKVVASVQN